MPGPDSVSGELWPQGIVANSAFCVLMLSSLHTQTLSR